MSTVPFTWAPRGRCCLNQRPVRAQKEPSLRRRESPPGRLPEIKPLEQVMMTTARRRCPFADRDDLARARCLEYPSAGSAPACQAMVSSRSDPPPSSESAVVTQHQFRCARTLQANFLQQDRRLSLARRPQPWPDRPGGPPPANRNELPRQRPPACASSCRRDRSTEDHRAMSALRSRSSAAGCSSATAG